MKKIYGFIAVLMFIPSTVKAHCPLCTAGAGALAVGAAYLGISTYVVGIFIGAFAFALGMWMSRIIKKEYIRHQKQIVVGLVLITTIIPLMPLLQHYVSFNVYWFGEYGTPFNRTYMISRFLIGSLIGAAIMYISPIVSLAASRIKNRRLFPYQGIVITFAMLFIASLFMQFAL